MNVFKLIRYLPMWCLYLLAQIAVWVICLQKHKGVFRTVDLNLQLAYPNLNSQQRQTLAKQSLHHQAKSMVESFKSWAMPTDWSIGQIHTVHNQHILTHALENPNGMLAIVPHLGTWEMMNAWLNQFGSPTIMYKPVKGKQANDFVLAGRQRLNATLVPTDTKGVMAILKTLKQGGFSILLPDHVPDPSGGVVVPFFGIPTMSSTLAPKLAYKTQCSLVGLSCIRRDDGKGFDIYCEKLDTKDLYHKDPTIATTALNQVMQQMISRFPSHYMWSYRRFKYVPTIDNIYGLSDHEIQQLLSKINASSSIIN